VLALAVLAFSVVASCLATMDGSDVLGRYGGIFETDESAFQFPASQDTNIDSLRIGNEKAMAFNNIWQKIGLASAVNNLEIKKNQDSGNCECCQRSLDNDSPNIDCRMANHTPCKDCCTKVNTDQISAGNREAFAFGYSNAANYVKIVTNQR